VKPVLVILQGNLPLASTHPFPLSGYVSGEGEGAGG
jgi:hypothetical protein